MRNFFKIDEQNLDKTSIDIGDKFFLFLFLIHIPIAAYVIPETSFVFTHTESLKWHGFIVSLIINIISIVSYKFSKGTLGHRILNGILLMTYSVVFISLSFGLIEHHFHILIMLPALLIYKDWRVLYPAAIYIATHHIVFGYCQANEISLAWWPLKLFKYDLSWGITLTHILYVLVETFILTYFAEYLRKEYLAKNDLILNLEKRVEERSMSLKLKNEELLKINEQLVMMKNNLIAQEKLAALGGLIAGVAHEMKNPLNIAKNSVRMLMKFFKIHDVDKIYSLKEADRASFNESHGDAVQLVELLSKNIERADSVVKSMLSHSRGESNAKKVVQISMLLHESMDLVLKSYRATKKWQPEFEIVINTQSDSCELVEDDFRRVFINIFENAFYSMQKKSDLSDTTYRPVLKITVDEKKDSKQLIVKVLDNGLGMSEDIISKVVEPFFTTKPAGEGTGLGMSITHDIIRSHNAEIQIMSENGKWAMIEISIPRTTEAV